MDKQLRQRIVGAILLLLLAAIVTPFLLRSPEQVRVALDMELPTPPASPAMPIVPAVSDEEVAEAELRIDEERDQVRRDGEQALAVVPDPAHEDEHEAGEGETIREPVAAEPEDDPPLSGWAVQVGSFSRAEGAAELAAALRDAGYRAFTQPFEQGEQRLHRVYLGPELQRDRAAALRERIAADEAFALQGLVVSLGP
ncbi:SPOR domain-containing protein [Isoalcanivorax indicus]|uniref:SPOR domain-containing protein n=1 Tax=Isoalcanivorax indicus TaxID=2202653 RepID=UPI000DB982AF|nr:SPOR domain-containing protein [Isoalcanivorax indicus]